MLVPHPPSQARKRSRSVQHALGRIGSFARSQWRRVRGGAAASGPASTARESQLDDLYRELLGRDASSEEVAQRSLIAVPSADAVGKVRAAILQSPEYARRQRAVTLHRESVFAAMPSLARPERIEKLTAPGRSRPLMLQVETTNICNNDCVICPYSSQTRKRQTMPLDLFEKLLSDYEELGGGPLSFTPLVGDIFVDKHLMRRVEMVKARRYIRGFSVTTNGVLSSRLDDAELDYLVASADRIKISIYGLDAEEYHAMTRKNQYDVAMENIARLVGRSRGNVVLGLRLLKRRDPAAVDRWIEDLRRRAQCSHPLPVKSDPPEYANWSFFDVTKPLPFGAKWQAPVINHKQCLIPLVSMQVTSSGDVSFCACANFDAVDRLMLGNVRTQSLAQMYRSETCRKLWDWSTHGVPDFCRTCSFHVPMEAAESMPWIFDDPIAFIGG
jgi:sulfatase maturation enzyme AslB (radical SAM superfamily)